MMNRLDQPSGSRVLDRRQRKNGDFNNKKDIGSLLSTH